MVPYHSFTIQLCFQLKSQIALYMGLDGEMVAKKEQAGLGGKCQQK